MISFFKKLQMIFSRDERNLFLVSRFAHANKDLLIIVADPKTDRIFATYNDRHVNGIIKSAKGKKSTIVRDVLKNSRFNQNINQYITALMETLHLPIWRANQFYQFIDGAVYKIADSLRSKRRTTSKKEEKKVPIPSPYGSTQDFQSEEKV